MLDAREFSRPRTQNRDKEDDRGERMCKIEKKPDP